MYRQFHRPPEELDPDWPDSQFDDGEPELEPPMWKSFILLLMVTGFVALFLAWLSW